MEKFGDPNRGTKAFDIELSRNDVINNFSYGVLVNCSDFISKMDDLGDTQFLSDQVKLKGSEFKEWYGYLSDGLMLKQLGSSPPRFMYGRRINFI